MATLLVHKLLFSATVSPSSNRGKTLGLTVKYKGIFAKLIFPN